MTYYVTGATGFLGGRVVELLLERGESVIALGRNLEAGKRLSDLGAHFVGADLTNRTALLETMPLGCSVIHCAALSSPWGKEFEFYRTNVLGTQMLAGVAMERQVRRFIHISTPSLYVERKSKENIREGDPLPPEMTGYYAATKLQAEAVLDQHVEMGLPAITLRPQGLFGPRDHTILPRLIRVAKKGFLLVMNPEVKIDFTYVDNGVEAIFCALNAPDSCVGKKYNITNDEPVDLSTTLEELLIKIGYPVKRKLLPVDRAWKIASVMEWAYRTFHLKGEPMLTKYTVCYLGYTRTLCMDKAKRELNYRPKYSMQEGLEKTVRWFKKA